MDTEFLLRVLDEIQSELQLSLRGVDLEQLLWRPTDQSNPMAWIAWHIARLQDGRAASLSGGEQLWVEESWFGRFGQDQDPDNHGRGHTDAEVSSVRPDCAESLSGYAAAAHAYLRDEVAKLSDATVFLKTSERLGQQEIDDLLFRAVHGGLAHLGQLMYVRGLFEHRHWFPR